MRPYTTDNMKVSQDIRTKKSDSLWRVFNMDMRKLIAFVVLPVLLIITATSTYAYQGILKHNETSAPSVAQPGKHVTAKSASTTSSQQASSGNSQTQQAQSTNNGNTTSSTSKTPYRPFVCTNVTIPRQTDYRSDDSMAAGATKLISQGTDGYYISCTPDSNNYVPPTNGMRVEPVNDVVSRGTGLDAQLQQQQDQAKAERDWQYQLNLTNCITNLQSQGVPTDTATSLCKSSVQY